VHLKRPLRGTGFLQFLRPSLKRHDIDLLLQQMTMAAENPQVPRYQ